MQKKLKIVLIALSIGSIILLGVVLYPKSYKVPVFQARIGTKYWDLSTGSKIGYTLISAKGKRNPAPIIFLQGGPGAPIFDSNIDVLSAFADLGYDVYLYDLVGCGHSERLENIDEYTVERHKKDLEAIILTIGAPKNILIAQSWGAILATQYLVDNEDKVERIIFTGAAPIFPIRHELENIKAPDSLHLKNPSVTNKQGKAKVYNMRTKFVEWVALSFGYKLASEPEMDDFASYLSFEMNKSTVVDTALVKIKSGYGYYVNIKTAQNFETIVDKREVLANCKTPVLVMRGQFDSIQWGYTTEYLELFKNYKFVHIPNAGHAIAKEQSALYVKTIADFLSTNFLHNDMQ